LDLEEIKGNTPLIVFDIDGTLVDFTNAPAIGSMSFGPRHGYVPLLGCYEMLQHVIYIKKLPIAFFSAGSAERNEPLIKMILERAFPDHFKQLLPVCPIYSDKHLCPRFGTKNLIKPYQYHKQHFNSNIDFADIILIDDRDYYSQSENLLPVPFDGEEQRLLCAAGILEEMLLVASPEASGKQPTYCNYLQSHWREYQQTINSPIAKYTERGIAILRNLNPSLSFN
jgi:hypothetical protein